MRVARIVHGWSGGPSDQTFSASSGTLAYEKNKFGLIYFQTFKLFNLNLTVRKGNA